LGGKASARVPVLINNREHNDATSIGQRGKNTNDRKNFNHQRPVNDFKAFNDSKSFNNYKPLNDSNVL
jgi:hypothetical protein